MVSVRQKTILILESHKALQTLYEAELQEDGFNTLLASSIAEAQQLLAGNGVDLLMSDLPGRRAAGLNTLVSLVRKRAIPLVINTSYPLNMIDWSAISGAAWIQMKSSDMDKLKGKINELLGNDCTAFQPNPVKSAQGSREATI